ncbi:MAG TPA: xyloglucanase, partial [Streptosporangiaceae bacterium]
YSTSYGGSWTASTGLPTGALVASDRVTPAKFYGFSGGTFYVSTNSGVTGIFRSDDAGANWIQINDSQHQWGNIGQAITGDPRVYGQVYVGTNGRGIIYGNPAGIITPRPPRPRPARHPPRPRPAPAPPRARRRPRPGRSLPATSAT